MKQDKMIGIYGLLIFVFVVIGFYSCKTLYVPNPKGPVTDHFDGKRFYNKGGNKMGSFRELMNYQLKNKKAKWPNLLDSISPKFSEFEKMVDSEIRYKQINHATVLVQHNNLNILTDPVFSERASPFGILGPKRHRHPSANLDHLPKIHVIVISHDHYDHLDIKSLKQLSDIHKPIILVGLGLKKFLEKFDIDNVIEMDWEESKEIGDINFIFKPAIHWSNRFMGPYKTLWGSWIFQSKTKTIYFAGDTAYGTHFKQISEQFPKIDLALIPIGAYVPRFFMQQVHLAPEDAIKAHQDLQPLKSLAIHWGTFQLTGESMFDPVDELQKIMTEQQILNFDYDRNHDQYYLIE